MAMRLTTVRFSPARTRGGLASPSGHSHAYLSGRPVPGLTARVGRRRGRSPRGVPVTAAAAAGGPSEIPGMLSNGFVDYYEILQVDDDAELSEIKRAYRTLAKTCHPDFLGNEGHDICILLNEAYDVLSDPAKRASYNYKLEQSILDTQDGYTGKILSKWMPGTKMGKNEDPEESRGVFVDENSCIGCKMCVWCASATFRMEPEYGRSRVFAQWLDTEDNIQASIDSCPVSCIHWVEKAELPALEHVMRHEVDRVNVGVMMAGQGGGVADVFDATQKFLKYRAEREAKAEKARRYSPAQEEARRTAVNNMMHQNLGFFAGAMSGLMGMAEGVMNGTSSSPGAFQDSDKVGYRRRAQRWDDPEEALANGATIPLERALVPVSALAEE